MSKDIVDTPSWADIFEAQRNEIFSSLNCHAIGKIEEFESALQTATISIQYERKVENIASTQSREDYPTLYDIPVIILGGGKGSLRFPISPGDECILLFNDRDIDNWVTSGTKSQLASDRKHSFSDAVALVGLRSMADSLDDYEEGKTQLVHDQTKITLSDKVKIQNATKNLFTIIDALLLALTTAQGIDTVTSAPVSLLTINSAATQARIDLALLME